MNTILYIILYAQVALCFSCLYRIITGPTIPDRMVAINILGILVVGICVIITIVTGRMFLIDIVITWIIFSFIGNITLAKYLSKKS